jgi:WD40 repeat protein
MYILYNRDKYGAEYKFTRQILIFNYEKLEPVGELTSAAEESLWLQNMAISKDAKYLAICSHSDSFITVWDLESKGKIRNYKLCNYYDGTHSGDPSCLKFSEINSDIIYLSGSFPKSRDEIRFDGLLEYNIQENRIVDSTFAIGLQHSIGYFVFFDAERILATNLGFIQIINFVNRNVEFLINVDTIDYTRRWSSKVIYSKKNDMFIGNRIENFSSGRYDIKSALSDGEIDSQIIYPQPTTDLVVLDNSCKSSISSYILFDLNGKELYNIPQLKPDQEQIIIDLSGYESGIYILQVFCGKNSTTYKIIKEM